MCQMASPSQHINIGSLAARPVFKVYPVQGCSAENRALIQAKAAVDEGPYLPLSACIPSISPSTALPPTKVQQTRFPSLPLLPVEFEWYFRFNGCSITIMENDL